VWEVVKVLEDGTRLVVAGDLPSRELAGMLRDHYEIGCLPGESVEVQRDPDTLN